MSSLAPGLLVAAPPLGDPNFDRSVVLLAAHGPDGAFGWVINGRELMTLPELLVRAEITVDAVEPEGAVSGRIASSGGPDRDRADASPPLSAVRLGGPVSPEQVWLVYPTEDRFPDVEGQFDVGAGITASASRKVLEAVAQGKRPSALVGLVGYAGWAPSQLENEIRGGAWLPTDVDARIVFEVPRERVWTAAYERIGTTPIAFTTRTVGSA